MGRLSVNGEKRLVAIAGPSGGGKSTICKLLMEKYDNLVLSISHTTRKIRKGEVDGINYFYVSKEKFQNLIDKNLMVEWALVHGNYYGTSKKFLQDAVNDEKIVLLDIDIQGVASLQRIFSEQLLSIFLMPPSLVILEERLRLRGTDAEEVIQVRLQNAELEMKSAESLDYSVVNHDIKTTFAEICAILEAEIGSE